MSLLFSCPEKLEQATNEAKTVLVDAGFSDADQMSARETKVLYIAYDTVNRINQVVDETQVLLKNLICSVDTGIEGETLINTTKQIAQISIESFKEVLSDYVQVLNEELSDKEIDLLFAISIDQGLAAVNPKVSSALTKVFPKFAQIISQKVELLENLSSEEEDQE